MLAGSLNLDKLCTLAPPNNRCSLATRPCSCTPPWLSVAAAAFNPKQAPEQTLNPSQYLQDPPHPDDEALFLHTSGTTARPKGVPLTHANLAASLDNIIQVCVLCS